MNTDLLYQYNQKSVPGLCIVYSIFRLPNISYYRTAHTCYHYKLHNFNIPYKTDSAPIVDPFLIFTPGTIFATTSTTTSSSMISPIILLPSSFPILLSFVVETNYAYKYIFTQGTNPAYFFALAHLLRSSANTRIVASPILLFLFLF